jgi:hypothetical protein
MACSRSLVFTATNTRSATLSLRPNREARSDSIPPSIARYGVAPAESLARQGTFGSGVFGPLRYAAGALPPVTPSPARTARCCAVLSADQCASTDCTARVPEAIGPYGPAGVFAPGTGPTAMVNAASEVGRSSRPSAPVRPTVMSHDDRATATASVAAGTAGLGTDEQPATTATATAKVTRSRRFIATAGPFVRWSPGADVAIRSPTIRRVTESAQVEPAENPAEPPMRRCWRAGIG